MTELGISLAFLGFIAWQNRQQARERAQLLQRIQFPEAAAREFAERPQRKPVPVIPVDDDAAYAEARERQMNGNGD